MVRGLVLTGGGARGAYQAGVLEAVAEIAGPGPMPFDVLCGTSAGAINAAFLAARADDFRGATRDLARLWAGLRFQDVFRTDAVTLTRTGFDWLADLGLGGLGGGRGRALLDTAPLRSLLERELGLHAVPGHVAAGRLRGLAVTATSYDSGYGITFIDGAPNVAPWERRTRRAVRARIGPEHVLASAAIPVFFPAVAVDGEWYGDGGVRVTTPLSPAIHLGAERIFAVGVTSRLRPAAPGPRPYPSKAQVASVLLDAMFMDALDGDVERVERINRTLALLPAPARAGTPLRHVDVLPVQPSVDLGEIGRGVLRSFPVVLRHLLAGLGVTDQEGWELVSYLAFDRDYTEPVRARGHADGMAHRTAVEALLGG